MVLSFHPGTVLEQNRGFLVSDNFLVTESGSVRLSPHTADRYAIRLNRG
jgi:Xaa-Pro aminopeptidase